MGRPKSPATTYAEHLGISVKCLKALGGMNRLRRMDEDARNTLVNQQNVGGSQDRPKTLKDLGMQGRTADFVANLVKPAAHLPLIPPRIKIGAAPFEMYMSDEDFDHA